MAKIIESQKNNFDKEESYLYRLEEMLESMKASLDNVEKVKSDAEELVKIVEASNNERFDEFLKDEKEAINNLSIQMSILEVRVKNLYECIEKCKENEEFERLINLFVCAVGMFAEKN